VTENFASAIDGPKFNFVDLFAGVGGLTLGFISDSSSSPCQFVPRLMVDIDMEARNVVTRNLPEIPYLVRDVHTLSGTEIKKHARLLRDEQIHVLMGGPPCQGFSWLGRRALDDARNVHLLDFLRLVKEIRPLVALMENVPLIITNHDGTIIEEICSGFAAMGYATSADILIANEYGVPQMRKRALVLAYRADLGIQPQLPRPTHERVPMASQLLTSERLRFEADKDPYISVEDAIGDLPQIPAGGGDEVMFYSQPPTSGYQSWARRGSVAVFNHRSRAHTGEFLDKIAIIEEGGRNQQLPDGKRFSDNYYSQAYARLHRHGLAQTITTHFHNPGSGRFTHYRELRAITVREAARFQSFPDTFIFDGLHVAQMRHVGNAVPPLLAQAVRNQIAVDLLRARADVKRPVGRPKKVRLETPQLRSRIMRAVKSSNTSVEKILRKALCSVGLRGYRLHDARVPGTPDVVFRRQRVAVFVDGCFWHGCPKCYREPQSKKEYWRMKVRRNIERDNTVNSACFDAGWRVVRFWEHDVIGAPARAASAVLRAVRKRKRGVRSGHGRSRQRARSSRMLAGYGVR
jgi:DNA (cytosine-5)-methyltransferase 1